MPPKTITPRSTPLQPSVYVARPRRRPCLPLSVGMLNHLYFFRLLKARHFPLGRASRRRAARQPRPCSRRPIKEFYGLFWLGMAPCSRFATRWKNNRNANPRKTHGQITVSPWEKVTEMTFSTGFRSFICFVNSDSQSETRSSSGAERYTIWMRNSRM